MLLQEPSSRKASRRKTATHSDNFSVTATYKGAPKPTVIGSAVRQRDGNIRVDLAHAALRKLTLESRPLEVTLIPASI